MDQSHWITVCQFDALQLKIWRRHLRWKTVNKSSHENEKALSWFNDEKYFW